LTHGREFVEYLPEITYVLWVGREALTQYFMLRVECRCMHVLTATDDCDVCSMRHGTAAAVSAAVNMTLQQ